MTSLSDKLFISCAGQGTRMNLKMDSINPNIIPKHALPLPLPSGSLVAQIVAQAAYFFRQIDLQCNEANRRYFSSLFANRDSVSVNRDDYMSGPLGPAIRHLLLTSTRTFLCGGDIFCDFWWKEMVAFHDSHECPVTILATRSTEATDGVCFDIENDRIKNWKRIKRSSSGHYINIGAYILDYSEDLVYVLAGLPSVLSLK